MKLELCLILAFLSLLHMYMDHVFIEQQKQLKKILRNYTKCTEKAIKGRKMSE